MAENIKGLNIELSLDSIGVQSGLRDVKQSMKLMNSELKNNMSSFRRSEKSMEKYGVQISGLNKKHEAQAKVVANAQHRYDDLSTSTTASTRQVEKAATELNNAQAQYNNLGRYIEDVTTETHQFERVQDVQSSTMWKASDAVEGFSTGLGQVSDRAKDVGWNLTKKVTLPAAAVVGAVGGMVASFGWGRLVAVDSAKAQLEGLGYSTEDVGRISEQVTSAIDGGMTTMAEGTAIAAGAMASGVEEGAELERYIKLVGDAAIGANRPVDDMAQIFNRVQGSGKLMTQELNQIQHGLPGFSNDLAEHLGVAPEEMRKMVTAGEVSSEDFLAVMETTAGGMAEAYANSWAGMVQNTKNYVGMIGESLLDGVFHKSKESIAEFINMLKSDDMQEKAVEFGKKLTPVFEKIVDTVKDAVKWYTELSDGSKKLINWAVGIAVALGPLLLAFGTIGGVVSKVAGGLASFGKILAPLTVPIKAVGAAAVKGSGAIGMIGKVIAFLSNPITIAIGVISALAIGFTLAYKKSETFRNFIQMLGEKVREVFHGFMASIQPGLDAVVGFFNKMKKKITDFINQDGKQVIDAFNNIWTVTKFVFGMVAAVVVDVFNEIKAVIMFVMPFVLGTIKSVWSGIQYIISGTLDIILGAVKVFSSLFTGNWSGMWEGVKDILLGMVKILWGLLKVSFFGQIIGGVINFVAQFTGRISALWKGVKDLFFKGVVAVVLYFRESFVGRIVSNVIDFVSNFKSRMSEMWDSVKNKFFTLINVIFNNLKNSFIGRIVTAIIGFVSNFKQRISDMWSNIKNKFSSVITAIFNHLKHSLIGKIISAIIGFASNFRKRISDMWNSIRSKFSSMISNIRKSIANSFVGRILSSITGLKDKFIGLAGDMWRGVKKRFDDIVSYAKGLPKKIGDGFTNGKDKAIQGMKNIGNGILKAAAVPVRGTISGINWVLGKIKAPKIKNPKWTIPGYAKGTEGHPGGKAMVGEEGRELISLPTGESFVSPDSHTLLDLPKGTQVVPNPVTERIIGGELPHYAKGTGGWKSSLSDMWNWIKKPGAVLKKLMGSFGLDDFKWLPKKIAKGSVNYLKDKPLEYLKGIFGKQENSIHNPMKASSGKPAFKWPITSPYGIRTHPITGAMKLHKGVDYGAPAGSPIPSTTGGKVNYAGYNSGGYGNMVKVNDHAMEMLYAHMSRIAVKSGNFVTPGQTIGYVGSTGNSTGPHLHYEVRKAGKLINPLTIGGHKTGGLIHNEQLSMLGEDGPEMVIPLNKNRRTDAMKLLALTGKMLGGDKGSSTRPNQMPTSRGNQSSDNNTEKLLSATLAQNEILMKLYNKSTDVYIDGKKATDRINSINAIKAVTSYF